MKLTISFLLLIVSISAFSQPAGYGFGKQILIQSSQVSGGAALTNFPIMVSFTDTDLRTTANGGNVQNANGYDIIFTEGDCATQLDHQIEKYNPTTGEYLAWVRIPSLPATVDKGIHMYYGNAAIAADPSSTGTWNANYLGVWHMSEDPSGAAPQITDWTAGTSNGTANGGMTAGDLVAGKCGDAIDFDGNNDYINLGDVLIDGLTQITVEAWIYTGSLHTKASPSGHNSNEGAIVHKNGTSDDNLGVTVASGATAFYIDDGGNNTPQAAAPTVDSWMHVVCTWDNATMTIYQDGASAATMGGVNGTFVNNGNSLRFGGVHGAGGGNPHSFDGLIDEIRISNTSRSANWVATEYNNENSPATFYNVSAEMTASVLCATLPIELLEFTAVPIDNIQVKLDWQTASELNNDYFTIERSRDGINWGIVGKVQGAGNSSTMLNYDLFDQNPYLGISYYRLKQTDFDGQFDYSKTINVKMQDDQSVFIYPNPTNSIITIAGNQFEFEDISIFNSLGQNVTHFSKLEKQGDEIIIIDLSDLSEGVYVIKTKTTANKVFKQ